MNHYLNKAKDNVKRIWIEVFWKNPHHLWALKVTISVAFLLIPAEIIFNNSYIGSSLALGAVAMASAETDVHPFGRLKSTGISLLLFFLTSSIVGILITQPVVFGFVLGAMIFSLTLLAGVNPRLQGVSFGTLFFITYAMLGVNPSEEWFFQPILYVIGAALYSTVSLLLLYFKPLRLLRGDISNGFSYLAKYIDLKAKLFPSKPEEQVRIRNKLAQQNIRLSQQIEISKRDLQRYSAESGTVKDSEVETYYRKWFLLQEMQERATSSIEQYDILNEQIKNRDLIEGFGMLMRQIARAIDMYADSILIDEPYQHPYSMEWTVKAMKSMLDIEKENDDGNYHTLSLLMETLISLEQSLRSDDKTKLQIESSDFYFRPPKNQPLSAILTLKHSRFRFAIRLTLCMILGYVIMHLFQIEKGSWILLTSLIVCQQTYSATRQRLLHRILGTLLGVLLGTVLAYLLPTVSGQMLVFLGATYGFFFFLKRNYIIAVIYITIYVSASFKLLSGDGVSIMIPRIIDTLIGGSLAYIVVRFIWPDWQYKQLPVLLHSAIEKNKRYFQSIYKTSVSQAQYLEYRLTAHNADNDLTSAWKDMWYEPKSKRHFQQKAFRLTDMNHALLSYISAFALHNRKTKHVFNDDEIRFSDYANQILQFVADTMSQDLDDALLDENIEQTIEWEKEIAHNKSNSKNKCLILIHNIAHVSREILEEARGLRQVREKAMR